MRLRGIIDRLDLAPDGGLVVVDYKTGRAPSERFERGSMGGVQTYALLCESVLGRAPAEVRLLYLRQPVAISAVPSEQTIRGQRKRAVAVWSAIERACDAEDFRPERRPAVQLLPLQGVLPRLRRVTRPPVSTLDEAVDAAFEPLRGGRDRPCRRRRLQPGRLRPHLGAAGRPQGAAARAGPAAGRRGARRRRVLLADREPGGQGVGRAAAARRAPRRRRPHAHQQQLPERPHPGRLLHRLACSAIRRRDGGPRRFAAAVAASRVHLRAHHPTDVIGGAVIGSVLGLGLRPSSTSSRPAAGGVGGGGGAGAGGWDGVAAAPGEWAGATRVVEL